MADAASEDGRYRRHSQQLATEFDRRGSLVVGHEAEVPDADETLRQHVQQEAADELVGGNGHRALLVSVSVVPPAECDVVAIEGEQSMIGDGDAMGVAAEITQHLLGAAEGGFGIDDPVLPKQRSQECGEAVWVRQVLDRAGASANVFARKALSVRQRTFRGRLCSSTFTGRKNGYRG